MCTIRALLALSVDGEDIGALRAVPRERRSPASASKLRRHVVLTNPGLEVGVLLDASAQPAGRTGRETLTIAQRFMGLPRKRVEEMLDLVSHTPQEASRRVRDYSLGMRQRLGIATALIGDPDTLILDEPANGLDPAGIRWMRDLLRDYADRGGTVLLSSHLLHEIEVVADDLVVIGPGAASLPREPSTTYCGPPDPSSGRPTETASPAPWSTPASPPHALARTDCSPTPTPSRSGRSLSPLAYQSWSCGRRTAPAWKSCS